MENIVTITIQSTHSYLVECAGGMLLFDAGWVGSLPQFLYRLKSYKIEAAQIKYVMFSHHHPDHAGLAQEIKNNSGAKLIIHEKQIPFLNNLSSYFEKKGGYVPIQIEKDDLISPNKAVLKSLGIYGEIVETPGHSDDSISLVLDSGAAFTGDLVLPNMVGEEQYEQTRECWNQIIRRNAKIIYPAHADPFDISVVKLALAPFN